MVFDTHAHYDDTRFDADRFELLANMHENGVGLIVNPGCDESSSRTAVSLAESFDYIYAAVGWHPEECESWNENSLSVLRELCRNPKVRAIGEIGLDYYYGTDDKDRQKEIFAAQMSLARELSLPVIVHDREAHGDSMDIVRAFPEVKGVFHCYSGSAEMAKELLSLGWYLSFTGSITFKNARKAPEVIAMCPLDRMMIETDSPYLAPVPFRGRRNDSTLLPYIAAVIAGIKGIPLEEVEKITYENGKRFFGI